MFLLVVCLLASFYTAFTADGNWHTVQRGEKAAHRKERREKDAADREKKAADDAEMAALVAETEKLAAAFAKEEKRYTTNYVGPVTRVMARRIKPSYVTLRNRWVETVWNPLCRATGTSDGLQKNCIASKYL
ncbi:hypothetical protein FJ365_04070 [Candidatus Dependentiae bacterium]|nr:hypothetical protein [Candidatus Dependentiae bacterium]